MTATQTGVLAGRRVLDVSGEMGSYGTRLLGELGADVIKVEPPEGDPQRRRPPFKSGRSGVESSLVFAYYNSSKRGVTLNVSRSEAEPLLVELAARCDAIVLTPSRRWPVVGFDRRARRLSWAPDNAIVVCLTPFGLDGPYRDLRATHLTSYAMSGLMRRMGSPEGPPVAAPHEQMHDQIAAHAAVSVLVGLRERPIVGGQFVELSLHELIGSQDDQIDLYAASAVIPPREELVLPPPGGVWECADGQVEILVHNPSHWQGFVELLGSPEALLDPALERRPERIARRDEIESLSRKSLAEMPVHEVVEQAQRLGIPCAARNTIGELVDDEQLSSRRYWRRQEHPVLGVLRLPGAPFLSSTSLLAPRRPAPLLAEHNEDVFCAELGHDKAALLAWKEDGLV